MPCEVFLWYLHVTIKHVSIIKGQMWYEKLSMISV